MKLNKRLFQAFNDLGLAQSQQGKFSEASKSFKKALAISPGFAPAHAHVARAYLQTDQTVKALQHARKAVELDSQNANYLNVEALCYRQAHKPIYTGSIEGRASMSCL